MTTMFYYLPNKRPIDVEGAIDAMLDDNLANRYFLDTEMGEVGCVEAEDDQKLASITHERNRYCELPHSSEEKQKEWMESFICVCIADEDAPFAAGLLKELHTSGFQAARMMLESSAEDSGWSWRAWAGDCAFEDLGAWLKKELSGFTYELKGCEDCAICRASKSGAGLHFSMRLRSKGKTMRTILHKNMNREIISNEFANKYPSLASWLDDGTIEIGNNPWGDSFIKVIDEGGVMWEGREKYMTIDEALQDAEKAIAEWMEENM